MYQAGFFPVMMFGLPAAAFAMYQTAKPEKKQYAAGILIAGAVASFVSGVTEPLEFSFMFLAPGLYLVHAVLTGISVAVAAAFHWTAGFCFSAGVTDFIFSCRLPMANQPFMLLVQGVVFAVIYYVVFRAVITKFDLPTPGREKEDLDAEMAAVLANDDFTKVAAIVLEGLGGKGKCSIIRQLHYKAEIRDKRLHISRREKDKIRRRGRSHEAKQDICTGNSRNQGTICSRRDAKDVIAMSRAKIRTESPREESLLFYLGLSVRIFMGRTPHSPGNAGAFPGLPPGGPAPSHT